LRIKVLTIKEKFQKSLFNTTRKYNKKTERQFIFEILLEKKKGLIKENVQNDE